MSDASCTPNNLRESPLEADASPASSRAAHAARCPGRIPSLWQSWDNRLIWLSDWFNPILVKETRQALRSWQFTVTFVLLLVACWVVTIGGVAMIGPSIYYAAGGGELLRAYYAILSLPLLVVVPFAAFRSLSAEREDNTFDLVSITTLGPRQIISGKLASAVVQMIVYFSAITPCLAFTYLLRGVDAPTIALLLMYTFFASLALSMLGLLLAAISKMRYNQLILSVGFVALLLGAFTSAQDLATEMIRFGYLFWGDHQFWVIHVLAATFYVSTFALAFLATAAIITFPTENRSTPLRIVMLVQQASLVGWVSYAWIAGGFRQNAYYAVLLALLAGGYWFAMGAMLNGEQPQMSRRAMRSLPQSLIGRAFFTWLNPGPSSGYMFSVANLTSILMLCLAPLLVVAQSSSPIGGWFSVAPTIYFLVIGWSYLVAYLGLGCLVVALLRKLSPVSMFASVLLHLLLVLAGSGIPTSIQWMSLELQNEAYSYLQATNPFWTLIYILNFDPAPEAQVLAFIVPSAAICILLLNLPSLVREVQQVRLALPVRVAEDEAALHPSPESLPQNPWDTQAT